MPHLLKFRKGWQSEHLAKFLLSKFSFIAEPSNISDDLGSDFFCTIFQIIDKQFLLPQNSFAIQIKSNRRRIKITNKLDYLISLEIPFYVGVINRNTSKLDIFSGEAVNHFFSMFGKPNEKNSTPSFIELVESRDSYGLFSKSDKEYKMSFYKLLSIDSSFDYVEDKNIIDDFLSNIRLIQKNISARLSHEYIFESPDEMVYIYAGSSSVQTYRNNFIKRLAEVFYNINWKLSQPGIIDDEFEIYERIYLDLENKYGQLPNFLTQMYFRVKKIMDQLNDNGIKKNIMSSNAIKWEEFQQEFNLLEDYQILRFEEFFMGDYVESHTFGTIRESAIGLNDFLKSLTKQELEIFLILKGKSGKPYSDDKTFIEILNYCLPRTNPSTQRPILFAIDYIIDKHELSREKLLENPKSLEKIANSDSPVKVFAINIMKKLGAEFKPPVSKQYFIKPNETYEFYLNLREIIRNARNYIHFIDNYANHVIIDYIHSYCNLSSVQEIKIITNQNISDLKLSQSIFETGHNNVNIEIRTSNQSHDRYLMFHDETWFFGPSVKDGGKKACTIVQLKDQAALDAGITFNQIWNSATPI